MEEKLFKSISEVCKDLDIPTHVLRFWEGEFSEIKPVRRQGGRRYYTSKDIEIIQTLKDLLYRQGYTLKGAKKYLRTAKTEIQKQPDAFEKAQIKQDNEVIVELARLRSFIKNLKFDLVNLKDILN